MRPGRGKRIAHGRAFIVGARDEVEAGAGRAVPEFHGEFVEAIRDDRAFAVDRPPRRVLPALPRAGDFKVVEQAPGFFHRLEAKAGIKDNGPAVMGHAVTGSAAGVRDDEGDLAVGRCDAELGGGESGDEQQTDTRTQEGFHDDAAIGPQTAPGFEAEVPQLRW